MSKRLLEMARSISPSHLMLAALVLWSTFAGMTLASCTKKLVTGLLTTYLSGQTQFFPVNSATVLSTNCAFAFMLTIHSLFAWLN